MNKDGEFYVLYLNIFKRVIYNIYGARIHPIIWTTYSYYLQFDIVEYVCITYILHDGWRFLTKIYIYNFTSFISDIKILIKFENQYIIFLRDMWYTSVEYIYSYIRYTYVRLG